MANKKQFNQKQSYQRQSKEKQYNAAMRRLSLFAYISIALSVLILLLLFVNFTEVYNSDRSIGVEIKVSGWSFGIAALTGNYNVPNEGVYGNLDTFYYFAKDWCETTGTFALLALIVILVTLAVQIVAVVKKLHILNCISAVLNVVTAILLIICFAKCLDMKNATILSDYCNGNPLCSIKSSAIVPALAALANTVVGGIATAKYMKASSLLK